MKGKLNNYMIIAVPFILFLLILTSLIYTKNITETKKILYIAITNSILFIAFVISLVYKAISEKEKAHEELKEAETLNKIYIQTLEKLNKARTERELFKDTIEVLIENKIAFAGSGYILNDKSNLLMVYESFEKTKNREIPLNEFLGKACIDLKKTHFVNALPDTLKIKSSLVEKLGHIYIYYFPIISKNKVIGVLECLSDKTIDDKKLQMLEKTIHHLGIGINQIKLNIKIRKLYKDLEKKNALLEAQYRELQAQSEELEAQTEELRAQKYELENYSKKLSQAEKYKSNFIANMSHELRTPLNSIIGLTDVLLREKSSSLDESTKEKLNIINLSGKQLLSIINDILDLTKIESGKMDIEIERFNIKDTIEYVASIIKPQCEEKGLYLKIDTQIEDGNMETDQYKVNQILLNILSNAVKYTNQGGITITATETKNTVKISVKDTGIGIDEKIKDKIFDPFVSTSGKIHIQGTGIGLALTKRLVELLGGNIGFTSKVGVGTEFFVTLPKKLTKIEKIEIRKEEDIHQEIKKQTKTRTDKCKPKILIADDDPIYLKEISHLLKEIKEDINILTAENGEEAKSIIEENPDIDLILLDLDMPKISGYELLDYLKKKNLNIKTIIITALDVDRKLITTYQDLIKGIFVKGKDTKHYLKFLIDNTLYKKEELTNKEKPYKKEEKPKKKDSKETNRILLVEDNFANRYVIKEMLKEYNLQIDEAENGKEAIEKLKSDSYDLILLDIQMPVMDGYETFKKIREELKLNTPVIALTAKALKDEVDEFKELGFDEILIKPIVYQKFIETLQKFIELKSKN